MLKAAASPVSVLIDNTMIVSVLTPVRR